MSNEVFATREESLFRHFEKEYLPQLEDDIKEFITSVNWKQFFNIGEEENSMHLGVEAIAACLLQNEQAFLRHLLGNLEALSQYFSSCSRKAMLLDIDDLLVATFTDNYGQQERFLRPAAKTLATFLTRDLGFFLGIASSRSPEKISSALTRVLSPVSNFFDQKLIFSVCAIGMNGVTNLDERDISFYPTEDKGSEKDFNLRVQSILLNGKTSARIDNVSTGLQRIMAAKKALALGLADFVIVVDDSEGFASYSPFLRGELCDDCGQKVDGTKLLGLDEWRDKIMTLGCPTEMIFSLNNIAESLYESYSLNEN